MSWRLARGLDKLRSQVNAKHPNRSKASDGTIGDRAHASRASDHNPRHGIVHALDLTNDPARGFDVHKLAERLRASKDSRISYCLEPSTPILCADLKWREIGALKIGDALIGFDEYGEWKPWHEGGKRNARMAGQKLRSAVVEELTLLSLPSRRVITDRCEVICSSDHAWLAAKEYDGKYRSWIATDNLKKGVPLQYFVSPWQEETSFEAGWVSGIFDGEGCLSRPDSGQWMLSCSQKEGVVLDHIVELLEAFDVNFAVYDISPSSCIRSIHIRGGVQAILAFLGRFQCVRLTEKAILKKIWEGQGIARFTNSFEIARVEAIENVGRRDVVAMQTSTRTMIANGIYSHNCISNRRIFSAAQNWAWRRYTGSNPHSKHIHISIRNNPHADNTKPWSV